MAQNLPTIGAEDAAIAAEAAIKGDLANLSPDQRTRLYGATCRSMGLNPLSQPFQYIKLNNKLTLYATRTATDQLRKINGVSITAVEKDVFEGVLMVTVHAKDQTGREDTEIGAVSIAGLKGESLANAHMKALTKAKRRVTLSISGLGWLDETEVGSIPHAEVTVVDLETGEISDTGEITQISEGAWDKASKRLHAIANEHGIGHDILHLWATENGYTSTRDVPADQLNTLASDLQADPAAAKRWAAKRAAKQPQVDAEPIEAEHRPINTAPPTDEEVDAALNTATPGSLPFDVPDDRYTR